jgi:hypothetical protein
MVKHNNKNEGIERVTLKLSKDVAAYFRKAFPHGKRSDFVADCILKFKHDQEIKAIEEELRVVGKKRQ